MIKLYRFSDDSKQYWESWDNEDGSYTVHWGELGTRGESKRVKSSLFRSAQSKVVKQVAAVMAESFQSIDEEDHATLLIEFAVDGMGSSEDLEKRARLEQRMNETLGWTGLGACDGGSIGGGTMEVCTFVVDFDLAKKVVAADLADTEFADYTRIYDEDE